MKSVHLLARSHAPIKRLVILTVLLAFALVTSGATILYGAPGTPGTPQNPMVIFEEDFQNRAPDSNVMLTDYTGTTGMTYTADPYWVDRSACNGFIVNYTSPYQAPDCDNNLLSPEGVYSNMLTIVHALGVHNNADPESFPAVASYTEGPGPADAIQFQTNDKVSLPSGSNFVSFSVDVGAVNCDLPDQPVLRFYLVDQNDNDVPVSADPINPCTDPNAQVITAPNPNGGTLDVNTGTFVAPGAILFGGNELGIIMRNETSGGSGNDSAYTNIRVLNVSPQLDKTFASSDGYTPGDNIPVTFTITNTSELAAKQGWSFTDNLPSGLVVADSPNVANTCSNSTVDAIAGATSFNVSGDLENGQETCQVTLSLTATTTGTFTNGPQNISVTGLNPPGEAVVTVGPRLADTGIDQRQLLPIAGILLVPAAAFVVRRQYMSARNR